MELSRESSKQPEVNIGMVGHVDHGKTTLTQALSGTWTDTHSEERKRGISIKLGYADTAFYKTTDGMHYSEGKHPEGEDGRGELLRVASFVDAPGHETLMAVMISGASIMDGALLLVAATEKCPQPQTREHLAALEIAGIENIVVVQNKIDIVSRERAMESFNEIQEFVSGTIAEGAPVIPVSAHHDVNLDVLIEAIEETIPTPERTEEDGGLMYVARSFDVNRPGSRPSGLRGGVIGGSIVEGSFSVGDSILIAPGRRAQQGSKTARWEPLRTTIEGIQGGGADLDTAYSGGLCGIATPLDPLATKADDLSGQVMAREGELPPIWEELKLDLQLLEKMVSSEEGVDGAIRPLQPNEMLMVNSATATSVGTVANIKGKKATLSLRLPICAKEGSRITLSRRVGSRWRLIGHGTISG